MNPLHERNYLIHLHNVMIADLMSSGLSGEGTRSSSLEGHKNPETSRTSGESTYIGTFNSSRRMSEYADDIDAREEKRTQRYLVVMVTVFAVCWYVPLKGALHKCQLWPSHSVYECGSYKLKTRLRRPNTKLH